VSRWTRRTERPVVAVVGAGIAGLVAAFRLAQRGADVRVLEASGRAGGAIRSLHEEGWRVELGPNTVPERGFLLGELITELGLRDVQAEPDESAATRYIVRDGELVALPKSPGDLVSSEFLSPGAKLRLLAEPLVGRFDEPDVDESLANFVSRRFGHEVLEYGIDPFIAGTYAGDPRHLSARHALGRLVDLEQDFGSILAGALRSKRAEPRRPLVNFEEGVETIVRALVARLGEAVTYEARVHGAAHDGESWAVRYEEGGEARELECDGLVVALPAYLAAELDLSVGGEGADTSALAAIVHPPITMLALGFAREDVRHPLDGFGVLIPSCEEGFHTLGAAFPSTIFEGRAPEGHALVMSFVGGARAPELCDLPIEEQIELALEDLDRLFGLRRGPVFTRWRHWPRSIPQYEVGYQAILDGVDALERAMPHAALAGNYRAGIAVNDTVTSGHQAAQRVADSLHL
jgi:oxygen-dependent protoporphyrinogen oxidase